jgi:polysaccharide export outer membrane protein
MKRSFFWITAFILFFSIGIAAAHDLTLGPGDELKISVYNNIDLAVQTRVGEDGMITFPLLGHVNVAGLTIAAAENKIAKLLDDGGVLIKPQVNIYVSLMQSQQMSVLGQVNHPGRFPVNGHQTVMDMIAMAGGIAIDGGDTVSLIRKVDGATTKQDLDINDTAHNIETMFNLEVQPGDVIYVERAPHFFIYGQVQKPGEYRLEKAMTVVQAISAGSGLTPRGTERGLRIKRRDAAGNLVTIHASPDDLLKPDDVVYAQETLF